MTPAAGTLPRLPPGRHRMPLGTLMAYMGGGMGGGSAYAAAAQFDRQVQAWRPPLLSADAEVLRENAHVRARARDLYRNHPYAKQIVRQAVLAVVGKKLRYSSQIDHKFFGIEPDEAAIWGREFDRLWDQYSHGPGAWCDAGRRMNFSAFMRLALRARMVDGETLVAFEWAPNRRWKTCAQIVDIDRLSNPNGTPDSDRLRGGIALDDHGAPIGYYVRNGHPADIGVDRVLSSMSWSFVPRETAWGRAVMAHSYLPERAAQVRGISDFTTVMLTMKQEGEFAAADLSSAIMQASYALVIKSGADYAKAMEAIGVEVETDENGNVISNPATELALQHLATASAYHNEAKIMFGANRIPHLLPGEELQMVAPGNKATSAPEFTKSAVKKYSAGLGGDPIAVSQDYSDVNYSSARMSVATNWRAHEVVRGDLVYDIGMPFVAAFMEEAVFSGALPLPAWLPAKHFYDALPALCRGRFLTAGPPMLDPTKERAGQKMGWELGLDTLEEMAADEGEDIEDKIAQKGREIRLMRLHGVPLPGEPVMPPLAAMQDAGRIAPQAAPADDTDDDGQ